MDYFLEISKKAGKFGRASRLYAGNGKIECIHRNMTKRDIKTNNDIEYLAWQEFPDIYEKARVENIENNDYMHSQTAHEFLKMVSMNPDIPIGKLMFKDKSKIIKAFGGSKKTRAYAKIVYPNARLEKADEREKEHANYRRMRLRVDPNDWGFIDNRNIGGTFF